jgi:hypothetical protein
VRALYPEVSEHGERDEKFDNCKDADECEDKHHLVRPSSSARRAVQLFTSSQEARASDLADWFHNVSVAVVYRVKSIVSI